MSQRNRFHSAETAGISVCILGLFLVFLMPLQFLHAQEPSSEWLFDPLTGEMVAPDSLTAGDSSAPVQTGTAETAPQPAGQAEEGFFDPLTGEWLPAAAPQPQSQPPAQSPAQSTAAPAFNPVTGQTYSSTGVNGLLYRYQEIEEAESIIRNAALDAKMLHNGFGHGVFGVAIMFGSVPGILASTIYVEGNPGTKDQMMIQRFYSDLDPEEKELYSSAFKKTQKNLRRQSVYLPQIGIVVFILLLTSL